jgi:8-oxo-dGTP pyrophosphatase MutT (NUDIX family)
MPFPDPCPAIAAARALQPGQRLPFYIGRARVGSVARSLLPVLATCAPWLKVGEQAVQMDDRLFSVEQRSTALAQTNAMLRAHGLVPGWRDEVVGVSLSADEPPLARIERAAARVWGTLTFGAHLNGYVRAPGGAITHLWIARRSLDKPTDPGKLDNLVAGGVPLGQTPFRTLVRECWEESGLPEATARRATPGRVLHLLRDVPEGVQNEQIYVYDLELPRGLRPHNIDGEVAEHRLAPIEEVVALLGTEEMSTDASLVTLDFLLRRRLLPAPLHEAWGEAARLLWQAPDLSVAAA